MSLSPFAHSLCPLGCHSALWAVTLPFPLSFTHVTRLIDFSFLFFTLSPGLMSFSAFNSVTLPDCPFPQPLLCNSALLPFPFEFHSGNLFIYPSPLSFTLWICLIALPLCLSLLKLFSFALPLCFSLCQSAWLPFSFASFKLPGSCYLNPFELRTMFYCAYCYITTVLQFFDKFFPFILLIRSYAYIRHQCQKRWTTVYNLRLQIGASGDDNFLDVRVTKKTYFYGLIRAPCIIINTFREAKPKNDSSMLLAGCIQYINSLVLWLIYIIFF
jgi:hypothetical protein